MSGVIESEKKDEDALYLHYFKEAADKILQESTNNMSEETRLFISSIHAYPYSVLGGSAPNEFEAETHVAPRPAENCVIVDPCSIIHLQSPQGPQLAHGLSGNIYSFALISNGVSFPSGVITSISTHGEAKYHHYHSHASVIHCAEPDFSQLPKDSKSRKKVVEELAFSYANIFREFISSGKTLLRLAPLSIKKKLSGNFHEFMSRLTYESLIVAFDVLDVSIQQQLLSISTGKVVNGGGKSSISLCVYYQNSLKSFVKAGFSLDDRSFHNPKEKLIMKELQLGLYAPNLKKDQVSSVREDKPIIVKVKQGQSAEMLAEQLTMKYHLPVEDMGRLENKLRKCIQEQRRNNRMYSASSSFYDSEDEEDEAVDMDINEEEEEEGDDEYYVQEETDDHSKAGRLKRAKAKLQFTQNKYLEMKLMLSDTRQSIVALTSIRIEKEMQRDDLLAQLHALGYDAKREEEEEEEMKKGKGDNRGSRISFSDMVDIGVVEEEGEEDSENETEEDGQSWGLADAVVISNNQNKEKNKFEKNSSQTKQLREVQSKIEAIISKQAPPLQSSSLASSRNSISKKGIDKNNVNNQSLAFIATSKSSTKSQFSKSFVKENKLKKRNSMMFSDDEKDVVVGILSDNKFGLGNEIGEESKINKEYNGDVKTNIDVRKSSENIASNSQPEIEEGKERREEESWMWDEDLWSWLYTNGKLKSSEALKNESKTSPEQLKETTALGKRGGGSEDVLKLNSLFQTNVYLNSEGGGVGTVGAAISHVNDDNMFNLLADSSLWHEMELSNLPSPEQLSGFLIGLPIAPQPRYILSSSSSSISSKTVTTPYLSSLSKSLKQKRVHHVPNMTKSSTQAIGGSGMPSSSFSGVEFQSNQNASTSLSSQLGNGFGNGVSGGGLEKDFNKKGMGGSKYLSTSLISSHFKSRTKEGTSAPKDSNLKSGGWRKGKFWGK